MAKRVAVAVAYAGLATETYIRAHVNGLTTGDCGITLVFGENVAPTWWPESKTVRMYAHGPVAKAGRSVVQTISPGALQALDYVHVGWHLIRHEVDVLFVEYLHLAVAILPVAARLGIGVIGHAHGYDVSAQAEMPGWKDIYRRHLPRLASVVAVSEAMRDRLVHLGARPGAVAVVPCGVSVPQEESPARAHDGRLRILSVGRLVEKKGPMFLLETFRRVTERFHRAELDIVGDGPFLSPMRQLVQAWRLNNVTFHGVLGHADTLRLMREATVLVQPSVTAEDGDMEGLPVVILEAMAHRLPVVSTKTAGIPQAITDSVSGFLVKPGDCEAMAAKVNFLLGNDAVRQQVADAALTVVKARFSIDEELRRLRDLIAEVRQQRSSVDGKALPVPQ